MHDNSTTAPNDDAVRLRQSPRPTRHGNRGLQAAAPPMPTATQRHEHDSDYAGENEEAPPSATPVRSRHAQRALTPPAAAQQPAPMMQPFGGRPMPRQPPTRARHRRRHVTAATAASFTTARAAIDTAWSAIESAWAEAEQEEQEQRCEAQAQAPTTFRRGQRASVYRAPRQAVPLARPYVRTPVRAHATNASHTAFFNAAFRNDRSPRSVRTERTTYYYYTQ